MPTSRRGVATHFPIIVDMNIKIINYNINCMNDSLYLDNFHSLYQVLG